MATVMNKHLDIVQLSLYPISLSVLVEITYRNRSLYSIIINL